MCVQISNPPLPLANGVWPSPLHLQTGKSYFLRFDIVKNWRWRFHAQIGGMRTWPLNHQLFESYFFKNWRSPILAAAAQKNFGRCRQLPNQLHEPACKSPTNLHQGKWNSSTGSQKSTYHVTLCILTLLIYDREKACHKHASKHNRVKKYSETWPGSYD